MTFDLGAALAAGYFVGGVPVAMLVARAIGHDIFAVGSGNMGAMNTARNVGPLAGVVVLVLDLGKGALAAAIGIRMAVAAGIADPLAMALAGGVGAVIGHAWSPYVRFRGGKALATAFGATLPIVPWAGGAGVVLLIALTLIVRNATVASVATLTLYPFLTGAVLTRLGWPREDAFAAATAAAAIAIVSIVKHLRARRARS
ncbi:MAG: glycerol-3-phosphate acyltransferase [Trueperaceae bacterium]|nr:glycerol-3-phosphate acyltransferase [Trueperaceae bacterium]